MKKILLCCLAVCISTCYAAIYVDQSNSTSVEYTDTPSDTSKEITAPPVNTVSSQIPPSSSTDSSEDKKSSIVDSASASSENTYKVFSITSPNNGATIQNQPVVPVEMNIEPKLLAGDKVQLYLDDKPTGTPNGTGYQELSTIERGTHTLYGKILNRNDQAIKRSNSVTLYVHRASTVTSPLSPPPPAPKPVPLNQKT